MHGKRAIGPWIRRGSAAIALALAASVGFSAAQQAKLTASDGVPIAAFGTSVAISADTAIVGAPREIVGSNVDQGSAYVFVRSGRTWTQQAQLLGSDSAADDFFGFSVAIEGDTALVGANEWDFGTSRIDQGAVYVFTRSGTTWTEQQQLTAIDGAAGDKFGSSVALSGDTALVGTPNDDVLGSPNHGSAYVYTLIGTTWIEQANFDASDSTDNDFFGASVALDGDTALVGSKGSTVGGNTAQGAAYVFTRSGTTWTEQQKLTASDGGTADVFGSSVALEGDTALAGAPGDGIVHPGATYVFTRSGTTWTEEQKLTASDGAPPDSFGRSVALSGDTLVVGAPDATIAGNTLQGTAYAFRLIGTTWTERDKLVASDGAASDAFGASVALSGETLLAGAPSAAPVDEGAAYVFVLPLPDADRDGVPDDVEDGIAGMNKNSKDTDGDGVEDGIEIAVGRDPVVADAASADVDKDGVPDAFDNSTSSGDADGDGCKDGYEFAVNGSTSLTGQPPFGDTDLSGGRPTLADAQLLTRISLGLTTADPQVMQHDLDINRSGGAPQRSDATLLTYFAQNRVPYLPYP